MGDPEPLAGGANNRVYRLRGAQRTVVLKSYFHHPDDTRDRMEAEWSFSRFAWNIGLRNLPEPLAADHEHRLALYGCVVGRKLEPSEVDAGAVAQALAFFRELSRRRDLAQNVPIAAEACFSVAEHIRTIDRRVEELLRIAEQSERDAEARAFVAGELQPLWSRIRERAILAAGSSLEAPLGKEVRCVSPSDFGFHNALRGDDGTIYFIDFEYAGWDDPAKLISDFFSQVALPVPLGYFEEFAAGVTAAVGDPDKTVAARARLLLPAYRIKWCCILLNEFRSVGRERRVYAGVDADRRKSEQLSKARRLLNDLSQVSPA